ncbi:hypothetical protein SODALDRAFT_359903 [Sodiomyces alkalinus F11]|uniref:Uncharacterized protein n=1 Tax=Sodiomyces alkalinus (strain CBS 110278 / VKM F-3762 / F11) TaxID=1314773 RepID=A0A3N2PWD3_SODAK|nr:hypothetical protein SODALDRAFT_359903 [Sodiomyces alkalinus F11]ROT38794.1 hypothetical protein SODALDRAFT_359903 [Sodiomyces alkalinus F11]
MQDAGDKVIEQENMGLEGGWLSQAANSPDDIKRRSSRSRNKLCNIVILSHSLGLVLAMPYAVMSYRRLGDIAGSVVYSRTWTSQEDGLSKTKQIRALKEGEGTK